VNEAPVVTRNVLLLTDGVVTLVLQASDPDTPRSALTYRVDTVEGGQFERATAPGQAVQVFTQAELDAAQVEWVAPAGSTSALYALRLSDGVSDVRVGSPALERRTALSPSTEMVLATPNAGDLSASSSAGAVTGTTSAGAAATPAAARRAEPVLAAAVGGEDDTGLGLGKGVVAAEGAGAARAGAAQAADVGAAVSRSVAARSAPALATERVDPTLDLPSETAAAPRRLVTDLDLWGSHSASSLAEQLDRVRQEVAEAQQAGMVSLASTALVSTGLSVGYVIWLVRGGVLMTSLMSVVPAWAGMDPLPVLAEMRRAEGGRTGGGADDPGDEDMGDDDPIEKLFSKARRLLVRPLAGPSPVTQVPQVPALPETPA
jgi:hypothetical protein